MKITGPNGLTFDMPEEQAQALLLNSGFDKAPAKTSAKTSDKAPAKTE